MNTNGLILDYPQTVRCMGNLLWTCNFISFLSLIMVEEQIKGIKFECNGSGGYAFIYLTKNEELKFSLGVPRLFFGNIGMLDKKRFTKYLCNKCGKGYPGSLLITYDNPNEESTEGLVLLEKGEYKCIIWNNIIAQYRKFNK